MATGDDELAIGAVLEPASDRASLPAGLYQIVDIDGEDIQVSRLHSNEDGNLGTSARKEPRKTQ